MPLFYQAARLTSTPTTTLINVGTTSTTILAADPARLGRLVVSNLNGVNVIWLGFNAAAVSGSGISIQPKMQYDIPDNYTGSVTGIGTQATGTIQSNLTQFKP